MATKKDENINNNLTETLYLTKSKDMKKKLIEGKNTKLSDCVDEKNVKW